MNQLDPIEELYDMYLKEEDTPRIVKVVDNGLDFDSDNKLDRLTHTLNCRLDSPQINEIRLWDYKASHRVPMGK